MLLRRISEHRRNQKALGGFLLAGGSAMSLAGILLSRHFRLEEGSPIATDPSFTENALVIGLLAAGAILLGLSLPFNLAVIRDRRNGDETCDDS